MSALSGARPTKSGRPLAEHTVALRKAILELTHVYTVMTVRQAFYALVSRGVVPKDETRGYRPVQRQMLALRREGLLPWSFVADETRWRRGPDLYDSIEDAIAQTARLYRRNLWSGTGTRIEVWLEKDALAGVLIDVTHRWGVDLMVTRGVSSATFLHSAIQEANASDAFTWIYTLYDHDAGGARAHRMVEDYFERYCRVSYAVDRLAVLPHQIAMYDLPTRPAKRSDPEAAKWGTEAVELDALPPDALCAIVDDAIGKLVLPGRLEQIELVEAEEREYLRMLGAR